MENTIINKHLNDIKEKGIPGEYPVINLDKASEYSKLLKTAKAEHPKSKEAFNQFLAKEVKAVDTAYQEKNYAHERYEKAIEGIDKTIISLKTLENVTEGCKHYIKEFEKFNYKEIDALNIASGAVEAMNEEIRDSKGSNAEKAQAGLKILGEALGKAAENAQRLHESKTQGKGGPSL